MGFFYRHNIHPYTECLRREETLRDYACAMDFRVVFQRGYDLEGFIQNVAFRESNRCLYCYRARLYAAAKVAKKTIAVVHNKETYGKGIAEEFVKTMEKAGAKPLLFEGVSADSQHYRPVIGKAKSAGAKGTFFGGGYAEAARFIKQAREQGFEGPIVMGDGCFNTDVAKIAGDAVRNCYIANISPINAPDENAQKFYTEYIAKHEKIVAFAPLGYVATKILIDAIDKSPDVSRASVVATLRAPGYAYDSILGRFTFKANGDSEGRKIFWHQFKDGEFEALSPVE